MAYAWDDVEDETPPPYPDFLLPEQRTFEDQEWRDDTVTSWVGSLILFMSCCGWQYPDHDHTQDYYSDLLYEEDLQLKIARQLFISRAGSKERKKRLRKQYGMRRRRQRVVGLVSRRDMGLVMNDALLDLDASISAWTGSCASDEQTFLVNSELEVEVLDRWTCACLSEAPKHCYQNLPMSQEVSLEDLVMPNKKCGSTSTALGHTYTDPIPIIRATAAQHRVSDYSNDPEGAFFQERQTSFAVAEAHHRKVRRRLD